MLGESGRHSKGFTPSASSRFWSIMPALLPPPVTPPDSRASGSSLSRKPLSSPLSALSTAHSRLFLTWLIEGREPSSSPVHQLHLLAQPGIHVTHVIIDGIIGAPRYRRWESKALRIYPWIPTPLLKRTSIYTSRTRVHGLRRSTSALPIKHSSFRFPPRVLLPLVVV
ncbi:hypothetical protein H6P81_018974 [Aristolochia fimbriata]|uniref:Uncharacterized protein n=1 Tax=Aristolochia fimbriata TaxID=158543 RepID=A0AAV7E2J2_ARIFI|nr:hypothetical protein H6P81_018974 [Aristolochia fimbriata]